ncbi:hypothetical protein GE09DRAFT_552198 [Coniochaeta sp. 2T2.1]|nr:hypothetical protein GE09DRAFT_552198 [Coniochaeta sp. 2T2.1]
MAKWNAGRQEELATSNTIVVATLSVCDGAKRLDEGSHYSEAIHGKHISTSAFKYGTWLTSASFYAADRDDAFGLLSAYFSVFLSIIYLRSNQQSSSYPATPSDFPYHICILLAITITSKKQDRKEQPKSRLTISHFPPHLPNFRAQWQDSRPSIHPRQIVKPRQAWWSICNHFNLSGLCTGAVYLGDSHSRRLVSVVNRTGLEGGVESLWYLASEGHGERHGSRASSGQEEVCHSSISSTVSDTIHGAAHWNGARKPMVRPDGLVEGRDTKRAEI